MRAQRAGGAGAAGPKVSAVAGSENQQWHIDSPYEDATYQPAHAVNVLVALADVPLEVGPT